MTDEQMLSAIRAAFGDRWHIWRDPARGWCALPLSPPFGDPVVADTPLALAEKLESR